MQCGSLKYSCSATIVHWSTGLRRQEIGSDEMKKNTIISREKFPFFENSITSATAITESLFTSKFKVRKFF